MVMENLLAEIEYHGVQAPDGPTFALWRAVIALVHVDGDLAPAERSLVSQVMEIFGFSDVQRETISADLSKAGEVRALFQEIELGTHRAQFFRLARIVIWCDGILHNDELSVIEAIKDDLGDEALDYASDLRWINRKPDLPLGEQASTPEENMIKQLIYQMIAFYEQKEEE